MRASLLPVLLALAVLPGCGGDDAGPTGTTASVTAPATPEVTDLQRLDRACSAYQDVAQRMLRTISGDIGTLPADQRQLAKLVLRLRARRAAFMRLDVEGRAAVLQRRLGASFLEEVRVYAILTKPVPKGVDAADALFGSAQFLLDIAEKQTRIARSYALPTC